MRTSLLGALAILGAPFATAGTTQSPGACTATAQAVLPACRTASSEEFWLTTANCRNLNDPEARQECTREASDSRAEALNECNDQYEARLELCAALGESRYDPVIDPTRFVDPRQIGKAVAPNPYLMLIPGRTMTYRNGDEHIVTTVTKNIVRILGVRCVEIHDVSRVNGALSEDTLDWLAQDVDGNVWYFGELSQSFEQGQLSSLDGSWKAGEDFAKPGILMKAAPAVGSVYRQEFSLGTSEDAARVANLMASATTPAASCRNDCLLTREFSPIEPDVVELKYYAPGVGLILTTEAGVREELIEVRP